MVVARPLDLFNTVMRPFIHLLNAASNAMLRPLGIKAEAGFEEGSSPEEVRAIIAQAHAGGHLDPGEAGMLTGVFHLHEQQARQVMTPIPAVVTVDISEDVGTALRRCISTGHTRLLVTEDHNPDRVKGVVHSNSLARILMADGPEASIEPRRASRCRSCPRPSRWTTCSPTCSATARRWPSSSTSTAASRGS